MFAQLEFEGFPTVSWEATNEHDARDKAGQLCNQNQSNGVLYLQWQIDKTIFHRPPRQHRKLREAIIAKFDIYQWSKLSEEEKLDYVECYADEYKMSYESTRFIFDTMLTQTLIKIY